MGERSPRRERGSRDAGEQGGLKPSLGLGGGRCLLKCLLNCLCFLLPQYPNQ